MVTTNSSENASLADWLPQKELDFLADTATRILKPTDGAPPKSLEAVLREVVDVFSGKQYGWEEAILDGLWYHYPSEVKGQRFCSEEALKNFLLLRTLNIPVRYCVVEGYAGTGLVHELVLVEDSPRLIVIDWDTIAPVAITDGGFVTEDGKKISYSRLEFLTEQEVLARVEDLRSGESFISAVESGQMLYRKLFDEGELEAYIRYFPQSQKVEFTFFLAQAFRGLDFYFVHSTHVTDGQVKLYQEAGICTERYGLNYGKIPLFSTDFGIVPSFFVRDKLDEETRRLLATQVLYNALLEKQEDGTFVSLKAERNKVLNYLTGLKADPSKTPALQEAVTAIISHYELLQKRSYAVAERFLDFESFSLALTSLCPTQDALDVYVAQTLELHLSQSPYVYLVDSARSLGRVLSVENMLAVHNKLNRTISEKVGVPAVDVQPTGLSALIKDPNESVIYISDEPTGRPPGTLPLLDID